MSVSVVKLARGAARTLTACALAEAVSVALHLPQPYWAMITALAILQNSTVQTLNAGRDQTIGAVLGALTGVGAIALTLLVGHRLAIFFLALLPLALATAWRPSLRMSCITLIIVVLVPTETGIFTRALDRVLEIVIGVGSGILVASVLFRSRAQRLAYDRAAEALRAMAGQSRLILTADADNRRDRVAIDAGHEHIAALITETLTAAEDARREGGSPAPHTHRFAARLVPLLRRLQSDLLFIDRAVALLPATPDADAHPRPAGFDAAFGCRPAQPAMREAGEALAARLADLAAETAATTRAGLDTAASRDAATAVDTAIDALDKDRSLALRFVLRMAGRDAGDLAAALSDEHPDAPAAPN